METHTEEPVISPEDTIRAHPDAGWHHQQHAEDTEEPIQAGALSNRVHAPYKYSLQFVNIAFSPPV